MQCSLSRAPEGRLSQGSCVPLPFACVCSPALVPSWHIIGPQTLIEWVLRGLGPPEHHWLSRHFLWHTLKQSWLSGQKATSIQFPFLCHRLPSISSDTHLWIRWSWDHILLLSLIRCVTLKKWFHVTELSFYFYSGESKTPHWLIWRINKVMVTITNVYLLSTYCVLGMVLRALNT